MLIPENELIPQGRALSSRIIASARAISTVVMLDTAKIATRSTADSDFGVEEQTTLDPDATFKCCVSPMTTEEAVNAGITDATEVFNVLIDHTAPVAPSSAIDIYDPEGALRYRLEVRKVRGSVTLENIVLDVVATKREID